MTTCSISGCAALAASALLALSSPAAAQTKAQAQTKAMATGPSHASQLKGALRAVAAAQTRYRASKSSYAVSPEVLRLPQARGVRVEILAAGPAGWQAKAVHQDQPGRSCVIFVGRVAGAESPRTDADREMAGEEGVPLCDRMR